MKLQDKTGAARRTAMIRLSPLAASLLLMLAGPAVATESAQTSHLVGNKPVAANIKLSPAAPRAGELVTTTWSYTDEDGDKESGSTVEWLIDGKAVAGQSGSQYTLPRDSVRKSLQVKVTPKSAAPANPAVGDTVSSTAVSINKPIFIGNVIAGTPNGWEKSWKEARQFCVNRGARLPTVAELQSIFLDNTSATSIGNWTKNFEMCDNFGWRLTSRCGGTANTSDSYWTSELAGTDEYWGDIYHLVSMMTGSRGNQVVTSPHPFVCMK
ncbi:hypothetical protein [Aeromonas sobria]|uniref:hypothetical protein n=1 Tax=Aeromonas sobria TaxID=646 RepID=UPI003F2A319D